MVFSEACPPHCAHERTGNWSVYNFYSVSIVAIAVAIKHSTLVVTALATSIVIHNIILCLGWGGGDGCACTFIRCGQATNNNYQL